MLFMNNWLRYFCGPASAEIDHRAGMGVAAAVGIGPGPVGFVPLVARPVAMAGDRLNVGVGVLLKMLARLPQVASPLNRRETGAESRSR